MSGISISSGFQLNSQQCLDLRLLVNTYNDMTNIPTIQRYQGMIVFVIADNKYYKLDPTDMITWTEFGSNSSSANGLLIEWVSGSNWEQNQGVTYNGMLYKTLNTITNSTVAPNLDTTNFLLLNNFSNKLDKIISPIAGDIIIANSDGTLKDSGTNLNNFVTITQYNQNNGNIAYLNGTNVFIQNNNFTNGLQLNGRPVLNDNNAVRLYNKTINKADGNIITIDESDVNGLTTDLGNITSNITNLASNITNFEDKFNLSTANEGQVLLYSSNGKYQPTTINEFDYVASTESNLATIATSPTDGQRAFIDNYANTGQCTVAVYSLADNSWHYGVGSSSYTLPVASITILGGVKQGSNTTIASDGTITANSDNLKMDKITNPIINDILTMDKNGNAIDSGFAITGTATTTEQKNVINMINELVIDLGNKQNSLGYISENIANKNQNNGYAGLDSSGKIALSQIPSGIGTGDMLKSIYDTNNNGIVDNSEALGGNLPSYYAPINSPVFTGTPQSVTPSTNDNSANIATTAYVQNQGYANANSIPTKISQLTNDSNFVKINDSGVVGDTTDTYSIDKIINLLNKKQNEIYLQNSQPTSPNINDIWIDNTNVPYIMNIYNGTTFIEVGGTSGSGTSIFDWVSGASYTAKNSLVIYNNNIYQCITSNSDTTWTSSNWKLISSGSISINDTTSSTTSVYSSSYSDNIYATKNSLAKVATSGQYSDLLGTPTIPTVPNNITTQGNTFNGANELVQLDSTGKLPSIDGSNLTNLPSGATINDTTASNTTTYSSVKINSLIPTTTDNLAEGTTNKYFTNARVINAISGVTPITVSASTGAISISQATNSVSGYLSNTDWSNFNNKENAFYVSSTQPTGTIVNNAKWINTLNQPYTMSVYNTSTSTWIPVSYSSGTININYIVEQW
ncbi:hypothetical protein [Clostridium sp.]|uniref:beta strand repeat-containing protein n=1 Tax=Clostridium sp. TaxID=1506 RepID=UPI002634FC70|nr:hypothetical protein [Clostridium sp.]